MKTTDYRPQTTDHSAPRRPRRSVALQVLALAASYQLLATSLAFGVDSTINSALTNRNAYGANIGWVDWRADTTNGVAVGEFVLSGKAYGANVGWINFGNGAPTNGIRYTNLATNDFGVNNLGDGRLRGYAYGANIGWIVFTNNTATVPLLSTEEPRLDLVTGKFRGYAYSANCGWISLSNTFAVLKADNCVQGADTDVDGITDAWEKQFSASLATLTATGDFDGDGISDKDEYKADTNPLDGTDQLRITALSVTAGGSTSTVTWTSKQTRLYQVQNRTDLLTGSWSTNTPPGLVSPDLGTLTTRAAPGSVVTQRFFRVQAIQPLKP